nr:MAG TPA_asm: hypothetical protein [Caudoviricetes sp.]
MCKSPAGWRIRQEFYRIRQGFRTRAERFTEQAENCWLDLSTVKSHGLTATERSNYGRPAHY